MKQGMLWLIIATLVAVLFAACSPIVIERQVEQKISQPEKNQPKVAKNVTPKPAKVKEQPQHQVKLPDFAAIKSVKQKKRAFFNYLRPAVVSQNNIMLQQRSQLLRLRNQLAQEQTIDEHLSQLFTRLAKRYRVSAVLSLSNLDRLLRHVDAIPAEIVLAQAANESAWGTSRFARIGLNFFGIWCYQPNCGMVPNRRDIGAAHEVAAFKTVEQAVARYFININRTKSYQLLRNVRAQLRSYQQPLQADIIATGLLPYSSRGLDYVTEILSMLRHNQNYFGLLPQQQASALTAEAETTVSNPVTTGE